MLIKNYDTMKNFIKFIFIVVFTAVIVSGCGTAKNFSRNSFVEEGTGISMKKDIAFDMAVNNALVKISNEHSSSVNADERQLYVSNETNRGRNNENYTYELNSSKNSMAQISEYKIVKRKYKYNRFRNRWECNVTVSVDFNNVQ